MTESPPAPDALGATAATAAAGEHRRRLARNALFLSLATGLARVAGLAREVVAASYFGVSGAMSAFTIAWQVPQLARALLADWALQSAFVPVLSGLVEQGRRREAFQAASALFTLVALVLGSLTAVFLLATPFVMPLVAPGFADQEGLRDLTIALARIMFPIVPLLAVFGLVAGTLASFEHFAIPALAGVVWNLLVIVAIVALPPFLPEAQEIYGYAIGVLVGTIAQVLLPVPWLRARGRLTISFAWRDAHVVRVLKNMVPITLSMGVMNINLLLNSFFGTLVSSAAPAAIDKAFRIYTLPYALFAEAVGTVLFPRMSKLAATGATAELRQTVNGGVRIVSLLVVPSAVLLAVLAEPVTRLLYERGEFDRDATRLVSAALVWWAVAMPFDAVNFFLARALYGLQRVWLLAVLTSANLVVNAAATFVLYEPFGIPGIVAGTAIAMAFLTGALGTAVHRLVGGLREARLALSLARIVGAAAAFGAAARGAWLALDGRLSESVPAQAAALAGATAAGAAAYLAVLWALRAPELREVVDLVRRRRPG